MNKQNQTLTEYFEKLKDLVPEIYAQNLAQEEETETARLYDMLKRTLSIIEAVYLQDREMFHTARVEEYGKIIQELKALGYEYHGNEELLEKAASQMIMAAKKPMEKAKGSRKETGRDRRAM